MGALPDIFDHTATTLLHNGKSVVLIDSVLPAASIIANIEAWKQQQKEKNAGHKNAGHNNANQ